MIDPVDILIEGGVGVQHRFAWSECDAVLRFPDRLELVIGDASVVIRASDWYRGTEALELADHLVPSELRVEVAGEPEPPLIPYRLNGLARHSSAVLASAAGRMHRGLGDGVDAQLIGPAASRRSYWRAVPASGQATHLRRPTNGELFLPDGGRLQSRRPHRA